MEDWLYDFIKGFETFKSSPYLDKNGIPTIGYGTTYYPNGKKVALKDVAIDEKKAFDYMKHYVDGNESGLQSIFRNWNKFPSQTKAALFDMSYNGGVKHSKPKI